MIKFKQSYRVVQNFINELDRESLKILANTHNLNLIKFHTNEAYQDGNITELYNIRCEKIVKAINFLDEIVILTSMLGDEEEA